MSEKELSQRLAAAEGQDFTDPNFFLEQLYGDQGNEDPQPPQGETATTEQTTAPAADPPAQAESGQPPGAAAQGNEPEIAGVLTRDGKHFMPYRVVEDLRSTARTQAERIAELQAAVERMEAEKAARADGTSTEASQQQANADALQFTEDELADLEAVPAAAKLVKGFQAMQAELERLKTAAPAAQQSTVQAGAIRETQDAIDRNPLLARWQAKGGELWQQAVELDKQLEHDPAWAGKPMFERFAEVQRRVAEDYGIPVPSTSGGTTAPAPNPPRPQARTPSAPAPTASDFNGSTVAGDQLEGLSRGQMVDRAMKMSVEELRASVGLSY